MFLAALPIIVELLLPSAFVGTTSLHISPLLIFLFLSVLLSRISPWSETKAMRKGPGLKGNGPRQLADIWDPFVLLKYRDIGVAISCPTVTNHPKTPAIDIIHSDFYCQLLNIFWIVGLILKLKVRDASPFTIIKFELFWFVFSRWESTFGVDLYRYRK